MKLAKTSPPDYVSGRWFLHEGRLFELQEGMRTAEVTEARVIAQVSQRRQGYLEANTRFLRRGALSPEGDAPRLVPFQSTGSVASGTATAAAIVAPGVGIDDVRVTTATDSVRVRVTFVNGDNRPSTLFAPFVVMTNPDGRQVHEHAGALLRLSANGRQQVTLAVPSPRVRGRYFLSVRPSDPRSGRAVGRGRYRIPVDVPPASP